MKRKTVSILLVAALISSLTVGCGKKEADTTPTETAGATEIVETESTEATEVVETENTETAEVAETETQEQTETAEQSPYSYADMSATMYAQKAVNVRDLPDTSGNKVGGLSTNDEVAVTGQCNETGWYRISYNGSEAFVSNSYLGENKVEVKQATQSASGQSAGSQQSTAGQEATATAQPSEELPSNPYTLNTLVEDTGSSVSYYILTEPGHGGIDLSMERQANTYIMNMGKMPVDNGGGTYGTMCGVYKEGAVWKFTIYYE